jgi:hypothetical protein
LAFALDFEPARSPTARVRFAAQAPSCHLVAVVTIVVLSVRRRSNQSPFPHSLLAQAAWGLPLGILVAHIAVPLLDREWAHRTMPLFFSKPKQLA